MAKKNSAPGGARLENTAPAKVSRTKELAGKTGSKLWLVILIIILVQVVLFGAAYGVLCATGILG